MEALFVLSIAGRIAKSKVQQLRAMSQEGKRRSNDMMGAPVLEWWQCNTTLIHLLRTQHTTRCDSEMMVSWWFEVVVVESRCLCAKGMSTTKIAVPAILPLVINKPAEEVTPWISWTSATQGEKDSDFISKTSAEQEQGPTNHAPDNTRMLETDLGETVADEASATWPP